MSSVQKRVLHLLVGIAATLAQFAMAAFERAKRRGIGRDCRSSWSLHSDVPTIARECVLGQQIVAMPALIVIALWIALQLFSEVGAIANNNETSDVGGVAYMAHIGGFLAGFLLTFLFRGTIAPQT